MSTLCNTSTIIFNANYCFCNPCFPLQENIIKKIQLTFYGINKKVFSEAQNSHFKLVKQYSTPANNHEDLYTFERSLDFEIHRMLDSDGTHFNYLNIANKRKITNDY